MALLPSTSNPRSVGLMDSGLAKDASFGCFMLEGQHCLSLSKAKRSIYHKEDAAFSLVVWSFI